MIFSLKYKMKILNDFWRQQKTPLIIENNLFKLKEPESGYIKQKI